MTETYDLPCSTIAGRIYTSGSSVGDRALLVHLLARPIIVVSRGLTIERVVEEDW